MRLSHDQKNAIMKLWEERDLKLRDMAQRNFVKRKTTKRIVKKAWRKWLNMPKFFRDEYSYVGMSPAKIGRMLFRQTHEHPNISFVRMRSRLDLLSIECKTLDEIMKRIGL